MYPVQVCAKFHLENVLGTVYNITIAKRQHGTSRISIKGEIHMTIVLANHSTGKIVKLTTVTDTDGRKVVETVIKENLFGRTVLRTVTHANLIKTAKGFIRNGFTYIF